MGVLIEAASRFGERKPPQLVAADTLGPAALRGSQQLEVPPEMDPETVRVVEKILSGNGDMESYLAILMSFPPDQIFAAGIKLRNEGYTPPTAEGEV